MKQSLKAVVRAKSIYIENWVQDLRQTKLPPKEAIWFNWLVLAMLKILKCEREHGISLFVEATYLAHGTQGSFWLNFKMYFDFLK